MTILVTGAGGQVGSEIEGVFNNTGLSVVPYGRMDCDITDSNSVQNIIKTQNPSLVINCAAYTAVDKAEEDEESAYKINVTGSENLALICSDMDIPLIHISTDYVFNGNSQTPYNETDQTNPESVYGKTKLEGEKAIITNSRKYVILRTSWVFGEHGNNFVKTMLRLAETRNELGIVNDQVGCPTSAKSIARTISVIAKNILEGSTQWGVYHFSGAPETTWYGFAAKIFDYVKSQGKTVPVIRPITTDEYPLPARRPAYSVLNCNKIKSDFSVSQSDWETDLEEVLNNLV